MAEQEKGETFSFDVSAGTCANDDDEWKKVKRRLRNGITGESCRPTQNVKMPFPFFFFFVLGKSRKCVGEWDEERRCVTVQPVACLLSVSPMIGGVTQGKKGGVWRKDGNCALGGLCVKAHLCGVHSRSSF